MYIDLTGIFHNDYLLFRPRNLYRHRLRILPPTWDDPEHWGFDIFVHYGIGADNNAYLCLEKMKGEPCPICEERKLAEGDTDWADKLKLVKLILVWVIDRDNEEEGPKLWAMPWTIDRDICKQAMISQTILFIDNPEEGYDIEFRRAGGVNKITLSRTCSPLENPAWLDYIKKHPLSETLIFPEYSQTKSEKRA